jgi:hypothetical protein
VVNNPTPPVVIIPRREHNDDTKTPLSPSCPSSCYSQQFEDPLMKARYETQKLQEEMVK